MERLIAQWEIFEELELQEFYGCDIDIHSILELIPPGSDSIDVKSFLQIRLVEILLEKFDEGSSTILLDTKRMKGKPAEVLIPKIEEIRRKEIRSVAVYLKARELLCYDVFMKEIDRKIIPIQNQSINLENLWLTWYGYQALSKCEVGLHTDVDGLKKIERTLKRMNAPLNLDVCDNLITTHKAGISNSMREFILSKIT